MDLYTPEFYGSIAPGCRTSAEVVVPLILERTGPVGNFGTVCSVVDVGCGQGWWGAEFACHGCAVTGVDGAHVPGQQIERFVAADLVQPLPELGRFDLAVSLEVAEHLPPARAAGFISDLCQLADTVVFSAAIPHQSGAGHINCQWPSYWAALFAEHGYGVDQTLRWEIWTDDRVEPWYRQNLLIATTPDHGSRQWILDVVHPEIHGWGR